MDGGKLPFLQFETVCLPEQNGGGGVRGLKAEIVTATLNAGRQHI